MNKIYKKQFAVGGEYTETRHGSEDRDEAVGQAISLCAQDMAGIVSTGRRAKINCGNWDGYLVFQVVEGRDKIHSQYGIKK